MAFTLDSVVPWGRSFDEYRAMFALTEADLRQRVLGCADGPASFNAGLRRRGGRCVSADPLYRFGGEEIRARVRQTYQTVLGQTRRNAAAYRWTHFAGVGALGAARMAAMQVFLEDYPEGRRLGRYAAAALPRLPFRGDSFGLALCSHYLFTYSDHLDLNAHLAALREMARCAREVRVFPLLGMDGAPSPHLEPVLRRLRAEGYPCEVRRVDYEFQKGGDEMLVVG